MSRRRVRTHFHVFHPTVGDPAAVSICLTEVDAQWAADEGREMGARWVRVESCKRSDCFVAELLPETPPADEWTTHRDWKVPPQFDAEGQAPSSLPPVEEWRIA